MENHNLSYLQIHPKDNLLVALKDLPSGYQIEFEGINFILNHAISAKHKFALYDLKKDDGAYMYGVLIGKVNYDVAQGDLIHTENLRHASGEFKLGKRKLDWVKPDVSKFVSRTFNGFHRENGLVGTANYWLVIPMVFCENRNVLTLKKAFEEKLGYQVKGNDYSNEVDVLISQYKSGSSIEELLAINFNRAKESISQTKLFPNIDGIKFLNHDMGCGGTRLDSDSQYDLLAGYITNPKFDA